MARLNRLAIVFLAALLIGCGPKEVSSEDVKLPDPYAGMSPEQKIDAIRKDPKINDMQRSSMISDAQKAAGQPVTGH